MKARETIEIELIYGKLSELLHWIDVLPMVNHILAINLKKAYRDLLLNISLWLSFKESNQRSLVLDRILIQIETMIRITQEWKSSQKPTRNQTTTLNKLEATLVFLQEITKASNI